MKKSIFFLLTLFALAFGPTVLAGDITVKLNGNLLSFDQSPIIENDRTLVPVRKIFEELGADVQWNEQNAVVTAVKGHIRIQLQIHSNWMLQNGELVYLEAAPKIVNDRTLVPLRAISESFGAQVMWDASSLTVFVTTEDAPQPSEDNSAEAPDFEKQVLSLVNQERQNAGLEPLAWNDNLAGVARAHSKDMGVRNFMSHTNPDGLSPFDRLKNAGISYSRAAENIAAGQTTPESVMQGWMNSEGHRNNILNPNLKEIGVGYYKTDSGYQHYWTQVFITK